MRRAGALLAVLASVLLTTATASFADPTPSPTAQPPEAPLTVHVDSLLPRVPVKHGVMEIKGTVTNSKEGKLVTTVRVSVGIGEVIILRGDLHDADQDRPPTQLRGSIFTPVLLPGSKVGDPSRDDLKPGQTGVFDLRLAVDDLGLKGSGVYPLDIEARAELDGHRQTLGLAPTWLPYFTANPKESKVAVALPLTDRPHQAPDGGFLEDDLASELATGRLHQVVAAATGAGRPCPSDPVTSPARILHPGPTRCESVPITFGLDPSLLSAAEAMATPDTYTVGEGKKAVKGTGKQAATSWLNDLKADVNAGQSSVLALPFGDPDVSALAASANGKNDVTNALALGDSVINSVLGPSTTLVRNTAWPPSGSLTPDAASVLATLNADSQHFSPGTSYLLDDDDFPDAEDDSRTPSAQTALSFGDATHAKTFGLVPDPYLSSLATGAGTDSSDSCSCATKDVGSRLAEQRFIAETAIIANEAPNARPSRSFLIAPDRGASVDPTTMTSALHDLGQLPWLCPVTLQHLTDQDEACSDDSTPVIPADKREIDTTRGELTDDANGQISQVYLRAVGHQRDQINEFVNYVLDQNVDSKDVGTLTRRYAVAVALAESSGWRGDPEGAQAYVDSLADAVGSYAKSVTLIGGKLLLTSSKGTLQVSLQNSSQLPVKVRVQFVLPGIKQPFYSGLVTVGPKSAIPVSVKVDAQRSGKFQVSVRMLDRQAPTSTYPQGTPFGKPISLSVRSTQYGRVALGITFAAAGVLFAAAGFRIVRRSLRGSPPETDRPADA